MSRPERSRSERLLERLVLAVLKLLNPFMKRALRSRMHWVFSRWFVLLEFTGRRSGKVIRTPASYFRDGEELVLTTKRAWWRNLGETRSVECWLRGRHGPWSVVVVDHEQTVQAALGRAPTWFVTLAALDDGRLRPLRNAALRRSVREGRVVLRLAGSSSRSTPSVASIPPPGRAPRIRTSRSTSQRMRGF